MKICVVVDSAELGWGRKDTIRDLKLLLTSCPSASRTGLRPQAGSLTFALWLLLSVLNITFRAEITGQDEEQRVFS